MRLENVDIFITGNSTTPTRFQDLVAGTYKKKCLKNQKNIF
ncbi:GGGtGRT protein [Candidatus Cetobacterium colombiensis]|uniref:GGGtGRT protein n=1 Tax=Candidatus Cetobacterium colombiensis TaxID=3073100 RepID=A0ABU4W9D8_9FUSO|nr:GGGtGRT protein [Candidatus Cetobacterium colombiensis]MDX8336147.1 GGGtGRT protein [Candidatus Cetobacterium colombiensis]